MKLKVQQEIFFQKTADLVERYLENSKFYYCGGMCETCDVNGNMYFVSQTTAKKLKGIDRSIKTIIKISNKYFDNYCYHRTCVDICRSIEILIQEHTKLLMNEGLKKK